MRKMTLRWVCPLWQYQPMRNMIAGLLCALFFPGICLADTTTTDASHVTELWEGSALTARFRVGMCHDRKGKAWGVLLLRHASGQEDTYHLYGTLRNNEFNLSHSSGHFLTGTLDDDGAMQGKAKLKNGLRLSLSGKRKINVPLAAPDCAPLPKSN